MFAAITVHVPTNLIALSGLVGAGVPLVAAVLKQDRFSTRTNTYLALAVAVVAAIVTCAANGTLNTHDLAASLLAIYTVASATYHGFWKPSGIEPALKTATSLPQAAEQP